MSADRADGLRVVPLEGDVPALLTAASPTWAAAVPGRWG